MAKDEPAAAADATGGSQNFPDVSTHSEGFDAFLSFLDTPADTTAPEPKGNFKAKAEASRQVVTFNQQQQSALPTNSNSNHKTQQEADPSPSPAIMCQQDQHEQQPSPPPEKRSGFEAMGDKVDQSIAGFFYKIGNFCSSKPKITIGISMAIAIGCAMGMSQLNTENRPEKLWVPQNTQGEVEQTQYLTYFPPASRFESVIATTKEQGGDALSKDNLIDVMTMHQSIATGNSTYEGTSSIFTDLCQRAGGACAVYDPSNPICTCLVISVLKMWNYDLATLEADTDVLGTLNNYGGPEDLGGVLGGAKFDPNTKKLVSAEAISISYFLEDTSYVEGGNTVDPINEAWEGDVFLETVQKDRPTVDLAYLSTRSFNDEFGGEISGDLVFVQVSYVVAFLFLGATLGSKVCGQGSRWAMSGSALVLIAMATVAGFGIASLFGLLYGPVHSILPFVLLGIGVDDAFVIANAFDREREGIARASEDDEALVGRGARALARAGASITVTSLTDLVAFAISSTSALPALASFCAYASINIFFLWVLAATFFTATMVLDEKRQRANRKDCLCCVTRKTSGDDEDTGAKEGRVPKYFRNIHAPKILSKTGKAVTLVVFTALFIFGIYGLVNLPVEDSARNFIPQDSYINVYSSTADEYFPSSGTSLYITFEGGQNIYTDRDSLAALDERVSGKSEVPPYIAEPDSDSTYQNVMTGLKQYLATDGTDAIGGVTLGADGWPTSYDDFLLTLKSYTSWVGPGSKYAGDIGLNAAGDLEAYKVKLEYVRLTKQFKGETIDDAEKQIDAMDATREMVESWDDLEPAFPYASTYIAIEGFKIIGDELYRNVGLAIACVGVIVLVTVASVTTAFIITMNVAFCIVEILGFMYALGIVIDSVSVINVVLAVGLSIDYSAHIGHCFMVKGGDSRDARATEALADIGSSVLNGATSTFLAVAILLFSKSYVFKTLSTQFALTVVLGVLHGLVLLPVLLSLLGPKPFASAEPPHDADSIEMAKAIPKEETVHPESVAKDSSEENQDDAMDTNPTESLGVSTELSGDKGE